MQHKQPALEWKIAQDDEEWHAFAQVGSMCEQTHHLQKGHVGHSRQLLLHLLRVLVLLIGFGHYRYQAPSQPAPTADEQQAMVYKQTEVTNPPGKLRSLAPNPALWGPQQMLRTEHVIYQFYQRDAATVAEIADSIDAAYNRMRADFGLPRLSPSARLHIEVTATNPQPDDLYQQTNGDVLTMPSPQLLPAPTQLSDAEILYQLLVVTLGERVLLEAIQQNPALADWPALMDALRLWHIWDAGGPLQSTRTPLVQWVYSEPLPDAGIKLRNVLPHAYDQLCTLHRVWKLRPTNLGIPLTCNKAFDTQRLPMAGMVNGLVTFTSDQVVLDDYDQDSSRVPDNGRGATILLATVIEYAVDIYGRERLPFLLAETAEHLYSSTLLPHTFGVSLAEFEAGWQQYLAENYGGAQGR